MKKRALWCIMAGLLFSGCQVVSWKEEVGEKPPWAHESDRIVFCHYFNWFSTPEVSGNWRNWDWKGNGPNHNPDNVLTNGRRDIASVFYPLIGPYDSSDKDVIEYHMLTAMAAKIDGFFIDWYGIPSVEERNTPMLLDMAEKYGFKMCICFEDKAMFGYFYNVRSREEAVQNAITNLNYILDKHAQRPGYLRIDGRPVIINFSWAEPTLAVYSQGFSPAEYDRILGEVRKRHDFYFIHDYHGHLRAQYWNTGDNVYPWLDVKDDGLDKFYSEVHKRRQSGQYDFVTTLVYPGFDNTGVWGWGEGPVVTPREDGAFYRRSWELAVSNDVRFVQIATWNDFGEGATIEPADKYGFKYLEMTEAFSAALKGMPSDNGTALRVPLTIYHARVTVRMLQKSDPEKAASLSARLDAAVEAFCAGRFDEATVIANAVAAEADAQ